MADLIPTTSKKTAADPLTERVMKARAGHAAFGKTMAAQSAVKAEAPAPRSFVSGMGGASNAPAVERQRTAQKASVLDALPVNAKALAKRYDDGVQAFVAKVYDRFAQTGEHLSFTASDAAAIMKKPTEDARRSVEALVSAGLLAPAWSSMGTLKGYLPGLTN